MSAKENDHNSAPEYKTGGWRAHYVLIVCTLLYVINYMDRQVFAVILQPMKIDLRVDRCPVRPGLHRVDFRHGLFFLSYFLFD